MRAKSLELEALEALEAVAAAAAAAAVEPERFTVMYKLVLWKGMRYLYDLLQQYDLLCTISISNAQCKCARKQTIPNSALPLPLPIPRSAIHARSCSSKLNFATVARHLDARSFIHSEKHRCNSF